MERVISAERQGDAFCLADRIPYEPRAQIIKTDTHQVAATVYHKPAVRARTENQDTKTLERKRGYTPTRNRSLALVRGLVDLRRVRYSA